MLAVSHTEAAEAVWMHSSRSSGAETKQVVIKSSQVLEAAAASEASKVPVMSDATKMLANDRAM